MNSSIKLFYIASLLFSTSKASAQELTRSNEPRTPESLNAHLLQALPNTFEIIWDTSKFEATTVKRELTAAEKNRIEVCRLDDDYKIIQLSDILSIRIFPRIEKIK
jgi:hypothetical protein